MSQLVLLMNSLFVEQGRHYDTSQSLIPVRISAGDISLNIELLAKKTVEMMLQTP